MRYAYLSFCLLFTSLLLPLPAVAEETPDSEAARLAGRYRFVSGEKNGGALSEDELKDSKVSITAKEIVATDRENKRTYVATYKLDTSKKPWRISMESIIPTIGAKAEGLISVEGETVKLIYALPGGKLPTDFKTKEMQHLWVLEVEKKPDANKPKE